MTILENVRLLFCCIMTMVLLALRSDGGGGKLRQFFAQKFKNRPLGSAGLEFLERRSSSRVFGGSWRQKE